MSRVVMQDGVSEYLDALINDSRTKLRPTDFAFSPSKRGCGGIVGGNEIFDGLSQCRDVLEAGATQGFAREHAEPDFDLIEPAGGSRREVEMDMGMPCQPGVASLVAAVAIQNHRQLLVGRRFRDEGIQEAQKVLAALSCCNSRCDLSCGYL